MHAHNKGIDIATTCRDEMKFERDTTNVIRRKTDLFCTMNVTTIISHKNRDFTVSLRDGLEVSSSVWKLDCWGVPLW